MEQAGGGLGPDFIGGVKNVTVPEGRDVVLSCSVVRLGSHKVMIINNRVSLSHFVLHSVLQEYTNKRDTCLLKSNFANIRQ